MPKKQKGQPSALTPGAVITILPSSNLVFGGWIDYSSSVPLDAYIQVLMQVQAATGGQATFDISGHITLGPTPTWSEGAATGTLEFATYDPVTGVTTGDETTAVAFTVAP